MAANSMMMVHRMQSEALEAFGLAVKNTFIDSAVADHEDLRRASRRSRSVPPMALAEVASTTPSGSRSGCSDGDPTEELEKEVRTSSPMSTQSEPSKFLRHGHESVSTGCWSRDRSPESFVDGDETSPSEAGSSELSRETSYCEEEENAAAEALGCLLVRECSFLRVTGFGLHEESNRIRRQRGAAKCVMLYVKSLPWAKRAKWLNPLLRSVAALLQARGCATKMQGGELYAKLSWSNNLARLDFAAARAY